MELTSAVVVEDGLFVGDAVLESSSLLVVVIVSDGVAVRLLTVSAIDKDRVSEADASSEPLIVFTNECESDTFVNVELT